MLFHLWRALCNDYAKALDDTAGVSTVVEVPGLSMFKFVLEHLGGMTRPEMPGSGTRDQVRL